MEFVNHEESFFESLPPGHIARFLPDVDFAFPDEYTWEDPAWGVVDIDSWADTENGVDYRKLFGELLVHPAIRRLIGIEQLTLPEHYATMPNAMRFSRWEHATGSAQLTSMLVNKWNNEHPEDNVSTRQKVVYILRTMLSDIAHSFGSHIGDWVYQDDTETAHDFELNHYLKTTGIDDILSSYEISLDEVCLTEIELRDFVECPAPALCIDRIDYGVREIHRTNPYFWDKSRQFSIDDFELIRDKDSNLQVAMKDVDRAMLFAKSFELLPKEDWSEPLQRLQTTLYIDLVRMILVAISEGTLGTELQSLEMYALNDSADWVEEAERHPRDILLYTEAIIEECVNRIATLIESTADLSSNPLLAAIAALDYTMRKLSEFSLNYVRNYRWDEIEAFTRAINEGAINPNAQIEGRDVVSHGTVNVVDDEHLLLIFEKMTSGFTIELPGRKRRGIDPIVGRYGQMFPLSEQSGYRLNYEAYETIHATLIYKDNSMSKVITKGKQYADAAWSTLQLRPRLGKEQLNYLQRSALLPLSAATDYWKFTRAGILADEEWQQYLAQMTHI